jgi:hypothetical protein
MKEEYIKAYYQYISDIDIEHIKKSLPSHSLPDFEEIMNGVILLLKKEKLEVETIDDSYGNEYLNQLNSKIKICEEYLENNKLLDNNYSDKQNLILAHSKYGNSLIKSDIESMAPENYSKIIGMLEDLKSGNSTTDIRKQRKLSNNKNLDGIFELKTHQVRLFYVRLDYNTVYVFLVKSKKTNNSKKDTNDIISRYGIVRKKIENLSNKIKNNEEKELLISENDILYNDIINYLNENKRGKNNEEKVIELSDNNEEKVIIISDNNEEKNKRETSNEEKFENLNSSWRNMYKIVEAIYKEEGKVPMKMAYKSNGAPVGKWLYEQKRAKAAGNLSFQQITLLENLGIDLNLNNEKKHSKKMLFDKKWFDNYKKLKEYIEIYGYLKIPTKDKHLSSWLTYQRKCYKNETLSEEKIILLESIGMEWTRKPKKNCNISSMVITTDESKNLIQNHDDRLSGILDSLSVDELSSVREEVDNRIKEIEHKRLEVISDVYETMYKMFGQNEKALSEFTVQFECDDEGLRKIRK